MPMEITRRVRRMLRVERGRGGDRGVGTGLNAASLSLRKEGLRSAQIEQAQAGQAGVLEQTPFEILPFEHIELRGGHFSAVGLQLPVQILAGAEQVVIAAIDAGD